MSNIIIPPVECTENGCTEQDKCTERCSGCENQFIPWLVAGVDLSSQPAQSAYIEPEPPPQPLEQVVADKLEKVVQAITELAAAIAEALAPIVKAVIKFLSSLWDNLLKRYAAATHPKWLHYYKHSKKKRVKKKYYNLIKRAFLHQLKAAGVAL